jgi:hypothetical protein
VPEIRDESRSGLIALAAFLVVVAILLGGYFLFPAIQRIIGYQDCIASGHITGC